jgi:transposase
MAEAGSLEAKPHLGPPRRLADYDYNELEQLLLEGATAHGWANNLWTAARVGEVIKRHFGVEYHPAHVSRILKEHLNWTCQRPDSRHRDRDDAAIKWWLANAFPKALAGALARRSYVTFIDEAGFMLGPTVRRTYAPCGQTPVNRVSNPHGRISAIGAITVSPRRRSVSLSYNLLHDNVNFRGPSVVQFIRALHACLGAPLTVFWDQIPIHAGASLEDYLASTPQVVVEPFPPYAPELNPADGIWRYLKNHPLANYTPADLGILRTKLTEELNGLRHRLDLLKSFIRFSKLSIEL